MIAWAIAGAITSAATTALHGYAAYCALLVGLSRCVPARRAAPAVAPEALPRFLVIVPAHDEEAVIEQTVQGLRGADYPAGRLCVFVVADHCSDATATLARRAGACVLERSRGPRGKSAAVLEAIEAASDLGPFDALAVFDADNEVDRGFFRAVARRLSAAESVVQGRVDSKNPGTSWVAASSALGFHAIAAVSQTPRERLGLSCPLMGTGWAARFEIGREALGALTSLTDDLELGAYLAGRSVRVAYEDRAVVFDEKPVALETALSQRHRWMQGRWSVAMEHVPKLLRHAMTTRGADRLRALDVAVQLIGPSLLFTAVVLGAVATADLGLRGLAPRAFTATPRPAPWASLGAAALYYVLPAVLMTRFEVRPAVWRFYAVQPLYLVLSLPLAVTGFLGRRSRRWRRTTHGA
jgi:cellulose synthase/poly-beta-1,6-N-acetylglucosamine synthase-like glycosyltransferase